MSVQRQIDRLIAYQAAEWYETLKQGDAQLQADFRRWISESPRHMEAFLAISSEAPVVRRVLSGNSFDLERLLKEVSGGETIVALRQADAPACGDRALPEAPGLPVSGTRRTSSSRFAGRSWKVWSAAATIAVISAVAALYQTVWSWQYIETPIGEQRTIQLAEGSIVNLNALSRVEVRFSESQREIRLPHGEATFKVAHDAARPFRVRTPNAIVEAVGTQFNVQVHADGRTTVAVLEGKVKVTDVTPAMTPAHPIPVAAGEAAEVESSGTIALLQNADVTEAIAWQQRKLIFKHTSLEDMAAEFNRYNQSAQIRLEGIDPGEFRFTGAFNADDPHSLATLLLREQDLVVEQRGEEIVIRKR